MLAGKPPQQCCGRGGNRSERLSRPEIYTTKPAIRSMNYLPRSIPTVRGHAVLGRWVTQRRNLCPSPDLQHDNLANILPGYVFAGKAAIGELDDTLSACGISGFDKLFANEINHYVNLVVSQLAHE